MPLAISDSVGFGHNATTTTSEAVAANSNREYLVIQNKSDTRVHIGIGEDATVDSSMFLNANGGSYEMSRLLGNLSQGAINVIHEGAGNKRIVGLESSHP